MTFRASPDDLALHGARVLGYATAGRIAARYRLDPAAVEEALLDQEATGWASRSSFAGSSGWSLTEAGRLEDERRLAVALDRLEARDLVNEVHADFVPLNERFTG